MNYKKETERITRFIKDYVKESGTKGIVLSMSGGIDSAVVAALCLKALGKKKIKLIYLPEKSKVIDVDENHIQRFCKKFGVDYTTIEMGHYVTMLRDCLYEKLEDMARANLKPRIRMVILYEYANNHSCLVVGTTNKSEYEIGYFTKHGDGACDLEPIQHLYKTEIFELAKYLGIPGCIINKSPSAGLWEGQTDEGEIGLTYQQLDKCLKLWESVDFDDDDMKKAGVTDKEVERVRSLLSKSQHKRRLPPCLSRDLSRE